ncbi:hypothetical protein H257_03751 [Aphanomyces astaci]|uniref:Uncharacterized protein n=1 Tax=Aphanomyces astaci TaxID=112090 RepID=W4H0B2_APHAT|nr:hypothetical protein H257_03751 [Aphanomyces astaci]ETV84583.1 hypothetical protein H257_03751 [Aphanomyces astaci]|eukprot:XP_009826275.1 hypothetical protein H257_03751 [Aphanomyces astaci]
MGCQQRMHRVLGRVPVLHLVVNEHARTGIIKVASTHHCNVQGLPRLGEFGLRLAGKETRDGLGRDCWLDGAVIRDQLVRDVTVVDGDPHAVVAYVAHGGGLGVGEDLEVGGRELEAALTSPSRVHLVCQVNHGVHFKRQVAEEVCLVRFSAHDVDGERGALEATAPRLDTHGNERSHHPRPDDRRIRLVDVPCEDELCATTTEWIWKAVHVQKCHDTAGICGGKVLADDAAHGRPDDEPLCGLRKHSRKDEVHVFDHVVGAGRHPRDVAVAQPNAKAVVRQDSVATLGQFFVQWTDGCHGRAEAVGDAHWRKARVGGWSEANCEIVPGTVVAVGNADELQVGDVCAESRAVQELEVTFVVAVVDNRSNQSDRHDEPYANKECKASNGKGRKDQREEAFADRFQGT